MIGNSKKIPVTGACGTVGKEWVHQLVHEKKVSELVGLDSNESDLFFMRKVNYFT